MEEYSPFKSSKMKWKPLSEIQERCRKTTNPVRQVSHGNIVTQVTPTTISSKQSELRNRCPIRCRGIVHSELPEATTDMKKTYITGCSNKFKLATWWNSMGLHNPGYKTPKTNVWYTSDIDKASECVERRRNSYENEMLEFAQCRSRSNDSVTIFSAKTKSNKMRNQKKNNSETDRYITIYENKMPVHEHAYETDVIEISQ
ncbi:unnamed protein product, partial [Meganyctiphanes norvegica]